MKRFCYLGVFTCCLALLTGCGIHIEFGDEEEKASTANQVQATQAPTPAPVATATTTNDNSGFTVATDEKIEEDSEPTQETESQSDSFIMKSKKKGSTSEKKGDYIFPDSARRYLQKSDVKGMKKSKINLAKNELYARHGRIFTRDDLNNYFQKFSWYKPKVSTKAWDAHGDEYYFNSVEIANRNFLVKMEAKK